MLEYTDDEDDKVRFSTEVEWVECAKIFLAGDQPVLRLTGKRAKDIKKKTERRSLPKGGGVTCEVPGEVSESDVDEADADFSASSPVSPLSTKQRENLVSNPTKFSGAALLLGSPQESCSESGGMVRESSPMSPSPTNSERKREPCPKNEKEEEMKKEEEEEDVENYYTYDDETTFLYEPESQDVSPRMQQQQQQAPPPPPPPLRLAAAPATPFLDPAVENLLSMFPDMTPEEANAELMLAEFDIARVIDKKFGGGTGPGFTAPYVPRPDRKTAYRQKVKTAAAKRTGK